ncbi:MAG: hypothetical protein ACRDFW_01330 [bacterium]
MRAASPHAAKDLSLPIGFVTEPIMVIEPTRGLFRLDLRAVWRYRELLYLMVWRDVKVRYKQTILGAAWAVLQPLTTMVDLSEDLVCRP